MRIWGAPTRSARRLWSAVATACVFAVLVLGCGGDDTPSRAYPARLSNAQAQTVRDAYARLYDFCEDSETADRRLDTAEELVDEAEYAYWDAEDAALDGDLVGLRLASARFARLDRTASRRLDKAEALTDALAHREKRLSGAIRRLVAMYQAKPRAVLRRGGRRVQFASLLKEIEAFLFGCSEVLADPLDRTLRLGGIGRGADEVNRRLAEHPRDSSQASP
jgi:hypothetical protein